MPSPLDWLNPYELGKQAATQAKTGAVPDIAKPALDVAWAAQDPLARSFTEALASARQRAAGKVWDVPLLSKAVAYADLRALVLSSVFSTGGLTPDKRPNDPYADRWGAALSTTGKMLASEVGYVGQPIGTVKQSAQSDSTAEVPIIAIVALIIATLAIAGVWAYLIYKSADVVDRALSRKVTEDELVRLHNEADKIVSDHLEAEKQAGHTIPWSQSELDALDRLERQQRGIVEAITPKPSEPGSDVATFGIGSLVGMAAVLGGLFYATKKGWL